MKLSYIETDGTNPYANLAMESALFETIEEDELILFLWQNEPSLIFGKNQNLWQECNLNNVRKDHVHLVRRPTGGGAVYHDLGNMNFTFLAKDHYFSIERNNTILLNALKKLDIDAEISGRNDLLVQNKKFSGHAYLHKSSTSLHHGTLLIHSDLSKMPLYLNVDQRKIKTKAVSSVKSRVINLQEIKPITLSDMKQSLRKAFEEEYGLISFVKEEPPHALITEFQKKYESEEWIIGNKEGFDYRIEDRFIWGNIDMHLRIQQDRILEASIFSDSLYPDVIDALQTSICNIPFKKDALLSLAQSIPIPEIRNDYIQLIQRQDIH